MKRAHRISPLIVLYILALSACMMYTSDWHIKKDDLRKDNVAELLNAADEKADHAGSPVMVADAIRAYERVLETDPLNYRSLTSLSHLYLLMGDGHSRTISEKKTAFLKALHYSELAMYTNQDFKQLIDQGEEVWDATRVLTKRDMEPMFFWTTAVFYYYKECLGAAGQVVNFRWIRRAREVLEDMTALDPDFNGGALQFTWGLYYLAIPESVGGDRTKSRELFAKAIDTGPDRLLNRWGRAKYYHVKMKNRQGFMEDLHWVLAQDINKANEHYAWKIFFKQDARRMLDHIDEYF